MTGAGWAPFRKLNSYFRETVNCLIFHFPDLNRAVKLAIVWHEHGQRN